MCAPQPALSCQRTASSLNYSSLTGSVRRDRALCAVSARSRLANRSTFEFRRNADEHDAAIRLLENRVPSHDYEKHPLDYRWHSCRDRRGRSGGTLCLLGPGGPTWGHGDQLRSVLVCAGRYDHYAISSGFKGCRGSEILARRLDTSVRRCYLGLAQLQQNAHFGALLAAHTDQ